MNWLASCFSCLAFCMIINEDCYFCAVSDKSTEGLCDQLVSEHVVNPVHTEQLTWKPFVGSLMTGVLPRLDVTGVQRSQTGFLTIGISSVERINGAEYLLQTIASLIDHMTAADQSQVTIVVLLAALDSDYNNHSAAIILQHYAQHINSGLIRLLQVSDITYYPRLDGLKRNFGDSVDRVKWRTKQVADFVLLFSYSRNISQYYLQLEDDVECARDFVRSIRRFIDAISSSGVPWTVLEFSELGFIGKLFETSRLNELISFMSMFCVEQPIDWLLSYYRLSTGQKDVLLRKPTLFQHIGTKSSFDITKDNPLKDRYYDAGDGVWSNADNPAAEVSSSMPPFKTHLPEMAYSSGTGFFWATRASVGDSLDVVLSAAHNVTRVVVLTGGNVSPSDVLEHGSLSLSNSKNCSTGTLVAQFTNGQVLVETNGTLVQCIRVSVDSEHTHWVLFSRIAVFL